MKRLYIAISGTDGSGKQTQTKLLYENLTNYGYKTKIISFPNYDSQSSGPVKMYLGGELCEKASGLDGYSASMLFMVDRLCTIKKFEKEDKDTQIVLFDRYVESNLIHQASKLPENEKMKFAKWELETEYKMLKLPIPDVTLFLDMPLEISLKLAHNRQTLKAGTKQDIHEKDVEYMKRSYDTGLQFAKIMKWNIISCSKDGEPKKIDEIANECFDLVKNKFHLKNKSFDNNLLNNQY